MQVISKSGLRYKSFAEPNIPSVKTNEDTSLQSVQLTAETFRNADCVVITTNHSVFDAGMIQQHARLIVDLRNVIQEEDEKVYKL